VGMLMRSARSLPSSITVVFRRFATTLKDPMATQKITAKDGTSIPIFTFPPPGIAASSAPAIIVIQEWWGINEQIKKHAEFIASKGYFCLIPDLYKGKVGVDAEEASHLMNNLNFKKAVSEINECALYLKEKSPGRKVGITGFCMGGALTLASAALTTSLDASVAFYGIPPDALCDVSKIKIPVQGHFGNLDGLAGFSDPKAVDQLEEKLKKGGVPHEIHRYPTVGHAFMNDTEWSFQKRKEQGFPAYDPEVTKTAWNRFFSFFQKHLRTLGNQKL